MSHTWKRTCPGTKKFLPSSRQFAVHFLSMFICSKQHGLVGLSTQPFLIFGMDNPQPWRLNPKRCGLLEGVLFGEMKFVLSNSLLFSDFQIFRDQCGVFSPFLKLVLVLSRFKIEKSKSKKLGLKAKAELQAV